MKRIVGLWVLCLGAVPSVHSQVDTSFIFNTRMSYGTLDLRIAKSPTRYYYLQEGITFSYRESAPGVKTNTYRSMTTWNTSAYGQGNLREVDGSTDRFVMNYRLLKPNSYNEDYEPGYPLIVMFHGAGESANCWIDERCLWATPSYNPVTNSPPAPTDEFHSLLNNDRNLLHGGAQHLTAVNLAGSRLPDDPTLHNKAFPGFVLFPQTLNGWGPSSTAEDAIRIIRLLLKKYNIDQNRIYIHGLSNGGVGVYQAIKRAPWLFAAALPMSAVSDAGVNSQGMVAEVAKIPLWIFQGGLDINPTPSRTYNYVRNFRQAGADVRYYLYENLGHGTWNTAYREPDFFSWILGKKKNNPHIYFGVPFICNSTQVGVRMGFTKGFFAYQWEHDGQIIVGATGAEFVANTPGTYRGRFSRKPNPSQEDWEPWSDPIIVREMNPDKPVVDVLGTAHLRGPGLPDTDANNTVRLRSADTAELYEWFKDGTAINFPGTDVDDTLRTATFTQALATANGSYTLVTYKTNCPSPPSDPVNLFFANSSPQNIALTADALDFRGTVAASSIFLSWNDVSGMETGYEIWRRKAGTADFGFVTRTAENAVSFHDINLEAGTTYEYKIRAVSNSGRSNYLPSDDIGDNYRFTTRGDFSSPPPPQDLKVVSNTLNTVSLSWIPSESQNHVKTYWIYFGVDSVNTGSNASTFTLSGLAQNSAYPVTVKAVDHGNHFSQPSNQVIATTYLSGLLYKHSTGAWESLDDSAMVATWSRPEFTGTVQNFTLQPRTQDDYFNFQFTGYLDIQTEGTYYFNLTSNDGSRLILDGNVIVDNDGIHGNKTVASDAIHLTTGPHAIEVQYFDDTGGHTLVVRYKGPGVGNGVDFTPIPNAALRSGTYLPPTPPAAPANVVATGAGLQRIDIAWQFADDGGTDYEVYRATSSSGPFAIVARAQGTFVVDSIGLIPGRQYYYKVKTVTSGGTSGFSNVASARTSSDDVAPSVPQNLELISQTLTNIAFTWNPATDNVGVTGYEVFMDGALLATSTVHAFTAENLVPNTQYVFTVKAVDVSGNRSTSSTELVVVTNTSATFYSLASGNLNELATWRRNDDGTGEMPQTFTNNGQHFVVSNRTSASLGGPWSVGGSFSRVIVPAGVTLTVDHPFDGNIELQGDAVLNLDQETTLKLVKASPQSTVVFNESSTIAGATTYGNVVLAGTAVKTFGPDTITILGDLTVGDGLPLKGTPNNSAVVQLAGSLVLQGNRPATAADNTIELILTKDAPQAITSDSDIHLYRIFVPGGQRVQIVNPSDTAVGIHLGSLQGGGLNLGDGAVLDVGHHDLIFRDAAVVNPGNTTGSIAVNGGDIDLASASAQASNLYFDADNHLIDELAIDLSGGGTAVIRSPVKVAEGVRISQGTLSAGGNLTLRSTEEGTAAIYEIRNDGSITGDVVVQQHIADNVDALRYLSVPVSGVRVSDWQESFPITGLFTGASPGGTSPSLFRYVENSWTDYPQSGESNTTPIERGVGYAARIGNAPLTISVAGNPFQGTVAFDLNDGWNFVGNPYASDVVWGNAADRWSRSGISSVIAIRRDVFADGRIVSEVSYLDAALGGVIRQGQAFWVRAFDDSPSLSIHEKAKLDRAEPATSVPRYFAVSLARGTLSDTAYVLFDERGTDGFDPELDGGKLRNYGMFNLSTVAEDTIALAVNHLSNDFCSKTIRLNLQDAMPGAYTFSFSNLEALTDIAEVVLYDHFTGERLTWTGGDHPFFITENPRSYGYERFELILHRRQLDLTTPQITATDVCAPASGSVVIVESQEGVLYQVLDANGNNVSDSVAGTGETIQIDVPASALVSGPNTLRVAAEIPGCDRVMFPSELVLYYLTDLVVETDGDVSVCEGDDVTLEASGAPASGFYKWFDSTGAIIEGQTGSTLLVTNVLLESVFYVASAHPDGCESPMAEVHIYPDTLDMPVIQIEGDTLYTDVVGYYQWKKNGEEIPGAILPYLVPVEDGEYTVVASSGGCIRESEPVQVGDPPVTGIGDVDSDFALSVYPVPSAGDRISVLLHSPATEPVLVEIVDALGRLHYSKVIGAHLLMQGIDLAPQWPLYDGIYFLRATQSGKRFRKKLVVRN